MPSVERMPRGAAWLWLAATALLSAGLIAAHGFREPLASAEILRGLFLSGAALFILSRCLLLLPPALLGRRMRRWWVDYVGIVAAVAWRVLDPAAEPILLQVFAIYVLLTGAVAAGNAGVSGLLRRVSAGAPPGLGMLFGGAVLAALAAGFALSLPAFWSAPVTGQKAAQYATHVIDCTFTAAAALTGTGLTPLDIGQDFSAAGAIALILLMQVGLLAVLVAGTAAAWRFRFGAGWAGARDDASPAGLRRVVGFACTVVIGVELIGIVCLYGAWRAPLRAIFVAVSAFGNVGLVPSREAFLGSGPGLATGCMLLLIVLGGLGGTVLYDVCRWLRAREPALLARETRITLAGTALLITAGTILLVAVESTPDWQLRYPREHTPGRLQVSDSAAGPFQPDGEGPRLAGAGRRQLVAAAPQRLRDMPPGRRVWAGLFESIAARTGGISAVRLDEASVSPSTYGVLLIFMLIGGGLGGTAGGLRIPIAYLLLANLGRGARPNDQRSSARAVLATVAGIACAMLLLVAITTLALLYRQPGSFEACLFEAVSACCNVGFSTGLTPQLSPDGKVLLIVTMVLGRVLPIALLLRACRRDQELPMPGTR